jgi:virulence-associated protein VagC
METLPVHQVLGLQLISLPDDLQFTTKEVFAYRDGIKVILIPANVEGEEALRKLRDEFLADPNRVRWTPQEDT